MISNTLSAPADACSPDADRAGPAMPENIARLLYVVRMLLEYGRHLAATIERRAAAPGFWLFAAVFGTTKLPVIRAYLHRGILRAAALESLLLQRAAAGRDVAAAPLPKRIAPGESANAHPCDEQFSAQVARLTAERAQHDAPADPDNLCTAEQIEAEIRARSIARTIADISRDFGIVAMMCTRDFWGAVTDAIFRHHDSVAVDCLEDSQPGPVLLPQPKKDPTRQRMNPAARLSPPRPLGFKFGARTTAHFNANTAPARPRHNVPIPERRAERAAATGPPLRAAMQLAA